MEKKAYYGDEVKVDENILLYKREDSEKYYCRILMPKSKGYKRKSTKTSDLGKALTFANQLFQDLTYKVNHNLPTERKSFDEIFEKWFKQKYAKPDRKNMIQGTYNRYFKPYFGEKDIEYISDSDIVEFWTWRRDYWSNDENFNGTSKSHYGKKRPSYSTIRMEKSILKEILSYGYSLGFLHRIPNTDPNFIRSLRREERNVRPSFSLNEWNILKKKMLDWVQREGMCENKRKKRELVRYIVLFLANTGLRLKECMLLKRKNIKKYIDGEDGKNKALIYVSPDTKTGYREVIGNPTCLDIYGKVKEIYGRRAPDDYVFGNETGKIPEYIGTSFQNMLREFGMIKDNFDKQRSLYSLRHFYITVKLLAKVPIHTVSKNCGTSAKQIELHYSHLLPIQHSATLGKGTYMSQGQAIDEFKKILATAKEKRNNKEEFGSKEEIESMETLLEVIKQKRDEETNPSQRKIITEEVKKIEIGLDMLKKQLQIQVEKESK